MFSFLIILIFQRANFDRTGLFYKYTKPKTIPINNPHPYPMRTHCQVIPSNMNLFSLSLGNVIDLEVDGESVSLLHFIVNGFPHRPKFPMYEEFSKFMNWPPD